VLTYKSELLNLLPDISYVKISCANWSVNLIYLKHYVNDDVCNVVNAVFNLSCFTPSFIFISGCIFIFIIVYQLVMK
jgi:hypothetical protein